MKVLVVEDYAPLLKSLRQGLTEAGFVVESATDGRAGLDLALSAPFDAVVLDVMLPQLDGLKVLESLRAAGRPTPVLILSARDQVSDRVRGLDRGADDYLVKPFAFDELVARLRALIRRGYSRTESIMRVGPLELDTVGRSVKLAGTPVALSAREYMLLEYLASRRGQVVSRSEIWDHVYDFASDPTSNVVDVYVGYLRKKLEPPGAPRLIHTRRGQGYVLELEAEAP